MAALDEFIYGVRSDEAGAAGNHVTHALLPPLVVLGGFATATLWPATQFPPSIQASSCGTTDIDCSTLNDCCSAAFLVASSLPR